MFMPVIYNAHKSANFLMITHECYVVIEYNWSLILFRMVFLGAAHGLGGGEGGRGKKAF